MVMSGKSGQSPSSTEHFFSNREWLAVNFVTPDDVDKAVALIQQQYPFITISEALQLNIYRACKDCCTVNQNTSGGGSTHRYLCSLRCKYDKTEREMPY